MNRKIVLLVLVLLVAGVLTLRWWRAPGPPPASVPLYTNLGSLHHPVSTQSPLAQQYFDQGLRLVYGFNHGEAIRSFEEAARQDPNCAMAYWGIALALGPNINDPGDAAREKAAYEAVGKALSVAQHASDAERAYLDALAKRYSATGEAGGGAVMMPMPAGDAAVRYQAYADAMVEVARRYPDDLDASTLYAEALMDLRPWDLWTKQGQPQPGTLEIVATLERVLAANPNHPGANHYYIHAVEASLQPERALPAARRLPGLMPGAGHLVHMPAHVFMRLGLYEEATAHNAHAASVDEQYIQDQHPDGIYPMLYYPHNLHFLWAAAAMEGRSAEAIRAARELAEKAPVEMIRQAPLLEFFTPTALFALARFWKWDDILKEPSPPEDLRYTKAMWHYARGFAFAAKGNLEEAAAEERSLHSLAAQIPADQIVGSQSAPALVKIASLVLASDLAARRGQTDAAVARLKEAVALEDGLRYDEPPPWYHPVRQRLGSVLLSAGRVNEAEAAFREDLKRNPQNGWSLYGLAQSLKARNASAEAAAVEQQFKKAWARADVELDASRL